MRCIDARDAVRVCTQASHAGEPAGPQPHWAVVQTYPQAERWCVANLRQRGYQTYLPLYAATVRDRVVRSMRRVVERPLFPGYAFVLIDGQWTPVRYCPGVARLLMSAGKPNIVARAVFSALQAGEDARRTVMRGEPLWGPGAACAVNYGACQRAPAVVVAVRGRKAVVATMMLGALREVVVSVDALEVRVDG